MVGSGVNKAYLIAAGCVAALPPSTVMALHLTLIDVHASFSRRIKLEARIANTSVAPDEVFTSAVLADARVLRTFVDV